MEKAIAIVHDKQAYSKGLADKTKKTLDVFGIADTLYVTIRPAREEYSALVTKL